YGFGGRSDVGTDDFKLSPRGLVFTASTPSGKIEVVSPLVGRFHVYNILAAIAAGLALGAGLDDIARGVADCRTVSGRFEQVTLGTQQPAFTVIVDYAHTADALRNGLQTAREVAGAGPVTTVFGCVGEGDGTITARI